MNKLIKLFEAILYVSIGVYGSIEGFTVSNLLIFVGVFASCEIMSNLEK